MRKRNSSLLLLLFVYLCSCSPAIPVKRAVLPDQRPEAEILSSETALIRTAECDLSVSCISSDQWDSIAAFNRLGFSEQGRDLPCDLFFITLSNTTDALITNITASCSYNGVTSAPMTEDQISKKISPLAEKKNRPTALLSVRRLTTTETELNKISLEKDTILYPFPFVLPLDRVCFLEAFPSIPKDARHFTVTVSYSTPSAKKKVDFKFTRFEHRDEE